MKTKSLRPLGFCLPDKNFAVPSWVPDWSISKDKWPLRTFTSIYPFNTNWQMADAMPNTTAIIEAPDPGAEHVLTASGYAMQTISTVGNDRLRVYFNALDGDGAAELQAAVMQDVYGFSGEPSSRLEQQTTVPAAIWRTLIADRNAQGRRPVADPVAADFAEDGHLRNVFLATISGRKLFGTKEGCVGLGPYEILPGDVVCLFPGAQVPFVLRQKLDVFPERFGLIGECYCHPLMSGARPEETFESRKFHIV